MGATLEQVVELVAAELGRSVRLIPNSIGERGEVWRIGVPGGMTVAAPTIYQGNAP
jgi:hypothetical protein